MNSTLRCAAGAVITLLSPFALFAAPPLPTAPPALLAFPTAEIDRVLGATGTWNEREQVYKVAFPRGDVVVKVDGSPLPPFLGLTSWVAFKDQGGGTSMMMGDLVLFQDEVSPVMDALLGRGAEVTALHNHFLYDDPRVFFMHIGGTGKAGDLAGAARAALDATRKTREARPAPPVLSGRPAPPKSALDAAALDAALGTHGQSKDGMYKAVFGRKARHGGVEVGADMGINTWAAFAGTSADAVVDGDFAVREGELQTVLKTLRKGGVDIVAIHQHMTAEDPRLIFLHYWARGEAARRASVVKEALTTLAP